MIPDKVREKIVEVLTHQPFMCDKVMLYEIKDNTPRSGDDNSNEFLRTYHQPLPDGADAKSKFSYGHFVGAEAGTLWGGRYYAGCVVGNVLVIVGKFFERPEQGNPPPPIDSYFLSTVRYRIAPILGVPADQDVDFNVTQATREGEQVLSELQALEKFEADWRTEYGNNQWLAVKDGTVQGHGNNRAALEKYIQEKGIKPPILYVPPKGEAVVANARSSNTQPPKVIS